MSYDDITPEKMQIFQDLFKLKEMYRMSKEIKVTLDETKGYKSIDLGLKMDTIKCYLSDLILFYEKNLRG